MDEEIEIHLSQPRRIPLKANDELSTVYFDAEGNRCVCQIRIEKEVGIGASCICYRVLAQFQAGVWHPYIMKEFYPDPVSNGLEIERDPKTLELCMSGEPQTLQVLRERFYSKSYFLQNVLSGLDALTDVVVAPTLRTESITQNKNPAYILYEMNPGSEIGSEFLSSADAESALRFAVKLTDSIQKLHSEHYLYMDIKPSNLLWTDHRNSENARVMLFDFDSAVDLQNLENLHTADLRITPALAAPELRSSENFEQDKRFLMRPCLDIYSIGCTIFWMLLGRFPEDTDIPQTPEKICTWENQIQQLCDTGSLREQVPAKVQEEICTILKTCICSRVRKRYSSAAALKRALKTVLTAIQLNVNRPAAAETVNWEIPVAHLFYENSLVPYVKDGVLSVGLVGASGIREEILKKLVSCCQMLDVDLQITVFDQEPQEYAEALCCLWPEIANCTQLYVNGKCIPATYCRFRKPLAQLSVIHSKSVCPQKLSAFSVLFLTNSNGEINYQTAIQLVDNWPKNQKAFIAYADTRGDGFNLRTVDTTNAPKLKLVPFGMNSFYSKGELSLASELMQLSFGVYRFYRGNPTDKETVKKLWEQYKTDRYGIRSNNRFILAMTYKLADVKLFSPEDQAAYFSSALNDERERARLLWLEHRSWSAFIMTEGYCCPTWEMVERYAYTGNNNQRNPSRRLHPCLCDSSITGLKLQTLPAEKWLSANTKEYDELDQVSLYLHRLCCRRVEKAKRILPGYLEALKAEMESEAGKEASEELIRQLSDAAQYLLRLDKPDSRLWITTLEQFKAFWSSQPRLNGTVSELLLLIESLMKPALDFCRRIDYKKYDLDVLQFIPELLQRSENFSD